MIHKSSPIQTIAAGNTWKSTACSNSQHTTAIKTDGTLWTWGLNNSGQLGNITMKYTSSPIQTVTGGTTWSISATNGVNTAATKTDGTLWLWGGNSVGQLGNNTVVAKSSPVQTVSRGGGAHWTSVSTLGNTTAGIKSDGTLWLWGFDNTGELGDGYALGTPEVPSGRVITGGGELVAGQNFAKIVAVDINGRQSIAGLDTPATPPVTPLTIPSTGAHTVVHDTTQNAVWVANYTTSILRCFNATTGAQIGTDIPTAANPQGIVFDAVQNAIWITCASANVLQKFDAATRTQIGTDIPTDNFPWFVVKDTSQNAVWVINNGAPSLQKFDGPTGTLLITVGLTDNPTGIAFDSINNRVWVAMYNTGTVQAFDVATGSPSPIPVATVIAHPMGLAFDYNYGAVWVVNSEATLVQRIDAATASVSAPISTGDTAQPNPVVPQGIVFDGGQIAIWVSNNASNLIHKINPAASGSMTGFAFAATPNVGSIAFDAVNNAIWAVTTSYSIQRIAANTAGMVTTAVGDAINWTWPAVGNAASYQIWVSNTTNTEAFYFTSNTTSFTQKYNGDAAAGISGTPPSTILIPSGTPMSSPIQTQAGGNNWKSVSCGYNHTTAIKTDGSLWLWGQDMYGQLGDGYSGSFYFAPIETISLGTNWNESAGGWNFTTAIKNNGTVWAWGKNDVGQLGDGTTVNKSSPIQIIAGGSTLKSITEAGIVLHQLPPAQGLSDLDDFFVRRDLFTAGNTWGWGTNATGNLGIGTTTVTSIPTQTSYGTNWRQISVGTGHTTAIKTDGTLWTWGDGTSGQLGDGYQVSRTLPDTVGAETVWRATSAGWKHTGAIKTNGTLWMWGDDTNCQLGFNNASPVRASIPTQAYHTVADWAQIAVGVNHAAGIKTDGTLWMWGDAGWGIIASPMQTIAGGTTWAQVSVGSGHTTAIKTDGTLWTWGYNQQGQLGDGTRITSSSPVQTIAGGTNWAQVTAAYYHTMAVKTDGTLWVWGDNYYGALATGTFGVGTYYSSPVQTIAGGIDWAQVSSSGGMSAATKTDGTLWTWGGNGFGNLGNGTAAANYSPAQTIAGGTNWKTIWGVGNSVAVTKTDGTLWTWGYNGNGELGDGTIVWKSSPVQTIAGGTNWNQVSCGLSQMAAIKTDGSLWTWGDNYQGSLGDGTTIDKYSPIQTIAGGTNWLQVSSGEFGVMAVKTDNTLWSWGGNTYGKLLLPPPFDTTILNEPTGQGTTWEQISCGYKYTGAIKTDGTLWMWGSDSAGQTATGGEFSSHLDVCSPLPTTLGGTNWKQLSCGHDHTGAIKTDGTLWMWGNNTSGQLGDEQLTATYNGKQVQTVSGGTDWSRVSCGFNHTGAIKTDGTLWLWGNNDGGQLGTGAAWAMVSSPVQTIVGGTNWKSIQCGDRNTTAIKADGTVWVWGNNTGLSLVDPSTPSQILTQSADWKQISSSTTGGPNTIAIAVF
jgi:alpha-tubulin suppressor-like RCC1 family protein